ncbi:MAG TPA: hypothetical protein VNF07_07060, partial [Acidimicrobiales bacterium]|nr:hypothetical protein [Acidimicrobiales bacterium]
MITGVDVSVFQHPDGKPIDYELAVEKGVDFAIIEYRDESAAENPHFIADHDGFKKAGALTGSYVYLEPSRPIAPQAEDLRMLAKFGPVWGDLEVTGGRNGPREIAAWWGELHNAGGDFGMVSYPAFLRTHGPFAGTMPLWVDDFGVKDPPAGAQLWGMTDKAEVPGIPALVDLDAFLGSRAQLEALFSGGEPAKKPVAPAAPTIAAAAGTPSGKGYWLASDAGDVFAFGDAAYHGSPPEPTTFPVISLVPTASGRGYRLITRNGTAHS